MQVFITDVRASKKQIKAAVSRLYDIQTKRINTLIRCAWCPSRSALPQIEYVRAALFFLRASAFGQSEGKAHLIRVCT